MDRASSSDRVSGASLSGFARAVGHLSIRIVGDLLAPPSCAGCDAVLSRDVISRRNIFCIACASTVVDAPNTSVGVVAAAEYGGAVAQAIRRLKYGGRVDLAEPLGHLLRRGLLRRGLEVDVVVPVPLHPKRLAERGFNQAGLLARSAAIELDADLTPRTLTRARYAAPQASLERDARLTNVAGAFEVRRGAKVAGLRVALVDDVVTTGATLRACEQALLEAGARSVVGVAVATTPCDPGQPPPAARTRAMSGT